MHWIVTRPRDPAAAELVDLLARTGTPHDVVAGGPAFGSIVPDVSPEGPVLCFGSYALRHVAEARGWSPGVVDVAWLGQAECLGIWGDAMLNADAAFCRLDGIAQAVAAIGTRAFVRPAHDTKAFEARVLAAADATAWLGSHAGDLRPDTPCVAAPPKEIMAEWRTWVVSGRVATSSLYRRGGKALLDGSDAPEGMLEFAGRAAATMKDAMAYRAPVAYVLDVALTPDGYRIVEVNCVAGARLYGCDVGRLFGALDALGDGHAPDREAGGPAP